MKLLAQLLIFTGFILYALAGYFIWLRNDPSRLAFQKYSAVAPANIEKKSLPTRIVIKDLHIDLPVLPAKITNNVWQTTANGVSYLTSSPLPGTKGNSIIYGHNWNSLFGNLVNSHPGEKVEIDYADGSKKTFTIAYTSVVTPDTASILAASKDKRITMYTCTGWFDSKRFVAVAVLDKSSLSSSTFRK